VNINFLAIFVAALAIIPIGFIWYNPNVFGNAWMKEIGKTPEDMKNRMAFWKIMVFSFIGAFFIAFSLNFIVVHQFSMFALLDGVAEMKGMNPKVYLIVNGTEIDYAIRFRSFGHGALHGTITGLFFVFPIIAQNAMYEQKSFKYIAIHAGYWIVTCAVSGGIICAWV